MFKRKDGLPSQEVEEALERGKPLEAFAELRPFVEYPGQLGTDERRWKQALQLFARVAQAMEEAELASLAIEVAGQLDDPKMLYELGYQLIERRLFRFAATVLAQADDLYPGVELIVSELSAALEGARENAEACRRIRASGMHESHWLFAYLLAFNSVADGDLVAARELVPDLLAQADDPDHRSMAERIAGMLARADEMAGVSALDERDLRGWHLVLNGTILLHVSPHGFDEGMRGRYDFTHDSPERCAEGIERLALALEAMGLRPPRVFQLADRESAILARAAAERLSLPLAPWRHDDEGDGAPAEPGLIVAYDLGTLEPPVLVSLCEHRPGQILFVHATCWTDTPPFAADFTTYLYQSNLSPWSGGLQVHPETSDVRRGEPTSGTVDELAAQLAAAGPEQDALVPADVDALRALAAAAARLTDGSAGARRSSGPRNLMCAGSPVKSSSFT